MPLTGRQPSWATERVGRQGTHLLPCGRCVLVLPKLFASETLYQVGDFSSHGIHIAKYKMLHYIDV